MLREASSSRASGVVRLAVVPNSVAVTGATDGDKLALTGQAYRLTLASNAITITGNSASGLFYGVQTFVQLLKDQAGKLWLPEATIENWPQMKLRVI